MDEARRPDSAAAAPNAHQKHKAPRLSNDPHKLCDWSRGKREDNELAEQAQGPPGPRLGLGHLTLQ